MIDFALSLAICAAGTFLILILMAG